MNGDDIVQLYTFQVGAQLFAVRLSDVKEVKAHDETLGITPVFHAAPQVEGYLNLRGELSLALDLCRMLGLEPVPGAARDLILFNERVGPSFGVLVDRAGEIVNAAQDSIEEWREARSGDARFVAAVCKNGDTLIPILAPERFLAAME